VESVFAVIEIAREKSAYKLLPQYSNLDFTKWADYFKKKNISSYDVAITNTYWRERIIGW